MSRRKHSHIIGNSSIKFYSLTTNHYFTCNNERKPTKNQTERPKENKEREHLQRVFILLDVIHAEMTCEKVTRINTCDWPSERGDKETIRS